MAGAVQQTGESGQRRIQSYPRELQASIERWAAVYHRFGGQDAFAHPLRVLERAVDHNMVELPKIGDREIDPKQLNLKLANIILAHLFRCSINNRADFPMEDFGRHQMVVDGFATFNALRENDLHERDPSIYGRILRKPSLGTLARCVDLAQYGPDTVKSEAELYDLDPTVFYSFDPTTKMTEYEHAAHVGRMIYSPLADLFGYRVLAGDIMEMSYYHLNRKMYEEVKLYLELLEANIEATHRLLNLVKLQLEAILKAQGYKFEIKVRTLKHPGKVMEKVDRYSRKDHESIEKHITALHDLVAFTVVLHSRKVGGKERIMSQNDIEEYRNVASIIAGLVSSQAELRSNGDYEHLYTDRITKPKPNGYQSFHVDMEFADPKLVSLEGIVRSQRMHEYADRGGAAHHLFKGGGTLTATIEQAYTDVKDAIAKGTNPIDTDTSPSYQRIRFSIPGVEPYDRVVPGKATIAEALVCGGIDLSGRYAISPSRSLLDRADGTINLSVVNSPTPLVTSDELVRQLISLAVLPSTSQVLGALKKQLSGRKT